MNRRGEYVVKFFGAAVIISVILLAMVFEETNAASHHVEQISQPGIILAVPAE